MNVLLTRAADQAEASAEIFSRHGLVPHILPLTEYKLLEQIEFLFDDYDFCILTSPFSAELFSKLPQRPDIKTYAAVGKKTAEKIAQCNNIKLSEILFAEKAYQTELLKLFDNTDLKDKNVLSPGPKERIGDMQPFFTAAGARFDRVDTYETVPVIYPDQTVNKVIEDKKIEMLSFFAPSAVHAFFAQAHLPAGVKVAAIGTSTADALKQYGVSAAIPERQSAEALAEMLQKEK